MVEKGTNDVRAARIWGECLNPIGTPVENYLWEVRQLALPPDMAGRVIRYHPSLWHEATKQNRPAMVAIFRDVITDDPRGISRTFLLDGKKLGDPKMLGRVSGAAIKLDPDDIVTDGLAIAEGIETALTGYFAGYRPAWALGSAGAIGKFRPLPGITAITIHRENDANGTNASAVSECASLWHDADCEVTTVEPLVGKDLNDAWRAVA